VEVARDVESGGELEYLTARLSSGWPIPPPPRQRGARSRGIRRHSKRGPAAVCATRTCRQPVPPARPSRAPSAQPAPTTAPPGGTSTEGHRPACSRWQQSGTPEDPTPYSFYGVTRARVRRRRRADPPMLTLRHAQDDLRQDSRFWHPRMTTVVVTPPRLSARSRFTPHIPRLGNVLGT
jgi:hypothetical protein